MVQKDQGGVRCEGIEKVGECPEGKIPTLALCNNEIWSLFQLMLPGLVGQGGYDYTAIQVVFDIEGIEPERRRWMLPQIVSLIDVIAAEKKARDKNAN